MHPCRPGADVIKVDSPGGDSARWVGPRKGDLSAMFITLNRGKRDDARAVLDRLVRWADVLVENLRPGALDRLGFAPDPRLATVAGRNAHRAEWAPALAEAVKAIDVDTLMDRFISHGAVGGRVNRIDEVAADRQVVHNGSIAVIDHGDCGRVATPRPAPLFDGAPGGGLRPAPRLGEHGAAILRDLGYAEREIAGMLGDAIAFDSSTAL